MEWRSFSNVQNIFSALYESLYLERLVCLKYEVVCLVFYLLRGASLLMFRASLQVQQDPAPSPYF
jgi:hypothetical protein